MLLQDWHHQADTWNYLNQI
uniref:Uncharacterized protein n=1 Tax=Arundo donax TaxID=35708 RepID=A0A0A9C5G6_ARUDO